MPKITNTLASRHFKSKDYLTQPWKNGQGQTLELAKDDETPWRWRLSSAGLEGTMPFSLFPEYDRVVMLLSGGPLVLKHSTGKQRKLQPLAPYAFSGNLETTSEIQNPGRDFNLFLLKGTAKAAIYPTYLSQDEELQFPIIAKEHFLYCVEGKVKLQERNLGEELILNKEELYRLSRAIEDDNEYLNLKAVGLSPNSILLWIPLHLI